MSNAGWYPDPGGAPGMFRYWDGGAWSAALSANPYAGPPAGPQGPEGPPTGSGSPQPFPAAGRQPAAGQPGSAAPSQPIQLGGRSAGGPYGQSAGRIGSADAPPGREAPGGYAASNLARRRSRGIGWWILIALLVLAMFVGGYTLLRNAGIGPFGGEPAASNPTEDTCPRRGADISPTQASNRTADGRVKGGRLSYPMLPSPWSPPHEDDRVPFGRDTASQDVMVEENYDGRGSSWVASVLVGELVAGDGFFSPEQGSEIVSRCVLGQFYGDNPVDRRDVVNRATNVGGKEAWEVEMHLTFDIPGLQVKGETAIILIVATGAEASSLYYASIPDSRPELLQTARQVQKQLRVEP